MSYIKAGQRFGRLSIEEAAQNCKAMIRCLCDCGRIALVRAEYLRSGHTKSCGCWRVENGKIVGLLQKHGRAGSPEYNSWQGMRDRCFNPNSKDRKYYGGRGIKVCDRWKQFGNFFADMGPKPTMAHSIDRINPDGDYEPLNCRWATAKEQQNNRRDRRAAQ